MNPKFNALKKTLTNIPLGNSDTAPNVPPPPITPGVLSSLVGVPVTKQRTTLNLSRSGGTLQPIQRPTKTAPVPVIEHKPPPVINDEPTPPPPIIAETAPPVPVAAETITEVDDFAADFETIAQAAEPETIPDEIAPPPPVIVTEEIAALRIKATKPPKPKKEPELDDMVFMNVRVPLYLKNAYFKKCNDRGMTPSICLRNFLKEFCGLCLVLLLLHSPAVAQAAKSEGGKTYTTAQILSYLQGKAFGGLDKVPNVRGTIGARHALWQSGAPDPVDDFTYTDYSNTRLEAKIEIPIFDLGYLRNKDKQKIEHRAFVMKSLSQILAAQQTVAVIESNITTMRQRRDYVNGQIKLGLANRSELFTVEDKLLTLQGQIYEAQSTLEQRIIDLAVLAENDWLTAYEMIIKWDGVLFDKIDRGGRRK